MSQQKHQPPKHQSAEHLAKIASRQAFDLTGRRAVVTGASRGIGEAVAKLLAAHGAEVIVSSRKMEGLEAVVADIAAAGGTARAIPCHIGSLEAMEALFAEVTADGKGLDILVNNAAANPHFGPIWETSPDAFAKTVDVNIRGYFVMSQMAARVMRERKRGSIINTASINGVTPGYWQGIYSVTKAAVISMTKAFAKELGPDGVRVNAVLPGLTETKFASALTQNEAMLNMVLPSIPLRRVADPEEIAPAFLYLASDASSYVTGMAMPIDGGILA